MKVYLFIASLVAFVASFTPPVLASWPGRNDLGPVPAALYLQPDQNPIINIDHNDSTNNGLQALWPFFNQLFQFPGSDGYGSGYYGTPSGGYPYSNNNYYGTPSGGYPYGNNNYGTPSWGYPYSNNYYDTPSWGYPYGNNDSYYNKPKRLTERQVVYAVENQRFHQIDKVWFDNSDSVYKVRAVDYYGKRVLLLVDPYNGRILRWSFRQ